MQKITFTPIGYLKSSQKKKYQASRQPDELSNEGVIVLNDKNNFEQALKNLEDCSHIWIIYWFHENKTWKPMVTPPRSKSKKGVFATRSPYRPNPIGLSVVKILKIQERKIYVSSNDLLDGTPILDIKPYHPEFDKIDEAKISWLEDELGDEKFNVKFSPIVSQQLEFIEKINSKALQPDENILHFKSFVIRQLEYSPTDKNKKRIKFKNNIYTLAYRTWRIHFVIQENVCAVLSISSGYSKKDLTEDLTQDKYKDKSIHLKFNKEYL